MSKDDETLERIRDHDDTKDLRTILNKGKIDKYELDEFMNG